MNAFEKNLLNKLLDKYESSKLSKGGTAISRSIKLTTKDDVLSSYVGSDSYKYADENDLIIKKLVELGFIKAEWNYDSFKSLTLVIENVDSVYVYLNRAKPADELERIIDAKEDFILFFEICERDFQKKEKFGKMNNQNDKIIDEDYAIL